MENSDMRHINMESLGNKTIAVTGATGLLGGATLYVNYMPQAPMLSPWCAIPIRCPN